MIKSALEVHSNSQICSKGGLKDPWTDRYLKYQGQVSVVVDRSAWKKWLDLEAAGNPGFFDQLLELFLQSAPAQMNELETALRSQDRSTIRMTSHNLGTSCENLGIVMFKALREIEAQSKTDASLPNALPADIQREFARALGEIQNEVQKRRQKAA